MTKKPNATNIARIWEPKEENVMTIIVLADSCDGWDTTSMEHQSVRAQYS